MGTGGNLSKHWQMRSLAEQRFCRPGRRVAVLGIGAMSALACNSLFSMDADLKLVAGAGGSTAGAGVNSDESGVAGRAGTLSEGGYGGGAGENGVGALGGSSVENAARGGRGDTDGGKDGGNVSGAGMGGSLGGGAGGAMGDGGGGEDRHCKLGGTGFDTATSGIALDLKTCLEWQSQSPSKQPPTCPMAANNPDGYCWVAAGNACEELALGGYRDWRLPTLGELSSIVVKGMQPSINQTIFPNTAASMYWTSETQGEKPNPKATCLDFFNDGMQNTNIGQTGGQAYRCVRGPLKNN